MTRNPRTILSDIRQLVGDTYLSSLYGINKRTLQRWTAQAPFVSEESIRANPMEKIVQVIARLRGEMGGDRVAQNLVEVFAAAAGGRLEVAEITPDKETVEEEMLDDATSLTVFREAIRSGASEVEVREAARRAKAEIDETLALYLSSRTTA